VTTGPEQRHPLRDRLTMCWRELVLTDLLFKCIAFVVLTPCVSLLLRTFLALTGRGVLTDLELARVLLHPFGWAAMIVVGAATIGIWALEQATLQTVCLSHAHGRPVRVLESLWFVAGRVPGVLRITGTVVIRLLLIAAPFLAAGFGLYVVLLGDHDINFYLTEKPPRFWIACGAIGAVLAVLAAVVIGQVVGWSAALPLSLFEHAAPREALRLSRQRLGRRRWTVAGWIVAWLALNTALSAIATAVVLAGGERLIAAVADTVWRLVLVLGGVLAVWTLVSLATSLFAAISLAVLLSEVYDRWARGDAFQLPSSAEQHPAWSLRWTRGRVLSAVAIGVAAAALLGATTIQTLPVADHVEISAHRGGGGTAPENTLAAIEQAIAHGAEWIEIDVQETKDGVVVVVHDADLKKVARFPGKIWETTAEELQAVDIGSFMDPRFSDQRVPTLAAVLDACRGRAGVVIELKYYGHDQKLEERVVEIVEAHRMADEVVVMSMERRGVEKIRRLRPGWRVGLVTAVAAGDLTRLDVDFLAVNSRLATEPFVQLAHSRDREVFVWTINDPRTMSVLISRGVDNLITDFPEIARRVLEERAALTPGERLLLELSVLFDTVSAPSEKANQ
jgi:glycerophosphoryl diester phosphodiesterase